MKKPVSRSLFLWLGLALLVACGDNLLADPSFDLWCGDKLCAPWESKGKVTRVGTWHDYDYGAALQDGAVLSQLTSHDSVQCIEFEVIADVDAKAEVWLELDFRDDGSSEYKQLIPESHWAKLRYLVKAPSWYDKLRFILRKQGTGRAVLAQIKATPSDECSGSAVPLLHRPPGAGCDGKDQCDSAQCTVGPDRFGNGLAKASSDQPAPKVCSECTKNTDCAAGELCAAVASTIGGYLACVKPASTPDGAWCINHAQCQSGICTPTLSITHSGCGACALDADCAAHEVCGVQVGPHAAARGCVAPERRALGDLCAQDAECKGGVCCNGTCSECCDHTPCKDGRTCGHHELWLTVTPSLCGEGQRWRKAGAACDNDSECLSGKCELPKTQCFLRCEGAGCPKNKDVDCGFVRQLAGVCR